MKFRHTILICMIIFSLLPLYALSGLAIYHNKKIIRNTIHTTLEVISTSQITKVKNFCENRASILSLMSQSDVIQDALLVSLGKKDANEALNSSYLENYLQQCKMNYDYLQSITLVNRDYILVSSTEPHIPGKTSALKNSSEQLTRDDFYMGSVFNRQINNSTIPVIVVYKTVYYNDEIIGFLVEEIPTSYFDTFRYGLNLTEGCTLYLTDKNGSIITAGTSDPNHNVQEISIAKENLHEFTEKQTSLDWESQSSGMVEYTVHNIDYLTYYSNVPGTDWNIYINADLNFCYKATEQLEGILLVSLFVLTLCLLPLNNYLSLRLTKALKLIMNTLEQVQETNNYSLRIHAQSKDEFGQLADHIDGLLSYVDQGRKAEEQQRLSLQQQATHDPLTGVYNKSAINANLDKMLLQAPKDAPVMVGFIDIDNFRNYNTLYGHTEGDYVLQFVAESLEKYLGKNVGRNGGDEFLFWGIKDGTNEELETAIQKFLATVNRGLYSETHHVTIAIPCSIGITIETASKTNRKTLIHHADQAMYHAKRAGKNQYYIINN